jgi:hypothetical protein
MLVKLNFSFSLFIHSPLFHGKLFSDGFSIKTVYSVRWWEDWWIGKNLEGSSCSLVEVLSQHLPGGTLGNLGNLSQDSWCPTRDLNQAPTECNPRTLLLDCPVWWQTSSCMLYLLHQSSTVCPVWKTEINGRGNPLHWPHDTLYLQKLALTSPTSCSSSVGVVHFPTKAMEFSSTVCARQVGWKSFVSLKSRWDYFFSPGRSCARTNTWDFICGLVRNAERLLRLYVWVCPHWHFTCWGNRFSMRIGFWTYYIQKWNERERWKIIDSHCTFWLVWVLTSCT